MTSSAADLWQFALTVYADHQDQLLHWQGRGAGVNDLLLLAFARRHRLGLKPDLWQRVDRGRPRQLLRRLRHYRFKLDRHDPQRRPALDWELALEQWDLALLADCLSSKAALSADSALAVCCRHWQIAEGDCQALNALVQRLANA